MVQFVSIVAMCKSFFGDNEYQCPDALKSVPSKALCSEKNSAILQKYAEDADNPVLRMSLGFRDLWKKRE